MKFAVEYPIYSERSDEEVRREIDEAVKGGLFNAPPPAKMEKVNPGAKRDDDNGTLQG